MNKKIFVTLFIGVLIGLAVFVSAESTEESEYKFKMVTIEFVDAWTLEPIINSQIEVRYDDDGKISEEKFYTTDYNGEIKIPIEGKHYIFSSDKGDNVNYIVKAMQY